MNLYLLLVVISALCFGLQFEPLHSLSQWQRGDILAGQWWRILTGNFTHTNFAHLAMNLLGLWVISSIFKPKAQALILALLVASLAVGIGNLATSMNIYVGLSGALHGLFGYFALLEALSGRRSSWLLVTGLIAKIVWEHIFGASETTSAMIHARVAIESHLAGALSGLALALLERLMANQRQSSTNKNA